MGYKLRRLKHKPDFFIETENENLIRDLKALYGSDIVFSDDAKDAYRIDADKFENPLNAIGDIIFDNTKIDEDYIALHAAAVGRDDKVYIFVGRTGAGKTTLCAYLTSLGFDYITDDCVLINKKTLLVLPYPKPIHLREGGVDLLRAKGCNIDMQTTTATLSGIRYIYTPNKPLSENYFIDSIFFIQRNEESINEIILDKQSNKLLNLINNLLCTDGLSAEFIKILMLLTSKCCTLNFADLDYVKDIIEG